MNSILGSHHLISLKYLRPELFVHPTNSLRYRLGTRMSSSGDTNWMSACLRHSSSQNSLKFFTTNFLTLTTRLCGHMSNLLYYYHTRSVRCDNTRSVRCNYTRSVRCDNTQFMSCDNTPSVRCDFTRSVTCDNTRPMRCDNTRFMRCDNTRSVRCDNTRSFRCSPYLLIFVKSTKGNSYSPFNVVYHGIIFK